MTDEPVGVTATPHLCRFCGRMREVVCSGADPDITICMDCAELVVEILRQQSSHR